MLYEDMIRLVYLTPDINIHLINIDEFQVGRTFDGMEHDDRLLVLRQGDLALFMTHKDVRCPAILGMAVVNGNRHNIPLKRGFNFFYDMVFMRPVFSTDLGEDLRSKVENLKDIMFLTKDEFLEINAHMVTYDYEAHGIDDPYDKYPLFDARAYHAMDAYYGRDQSHVPRFLRDYRYNENPFLSQHNKPNLNYIAFSKFALRHAEYKCEVTGIEDIHELAVTHIHPITSEDPDSYLMSNTLVMAKPLVQAYEQGRISFDEEGRIVFGKRDDGTHDYTCKDDQLRQVLEHSDKRLSDLKGRDFAFHRESVFDQQSNN
jgi:hypothetical protein